MEGSVTKLGGQKRRKNRVSVWLDGDFAFGLSREVALSFDLKEGDLLDRAKINRLQSAEAEVQARELALHFLSYRMRTEKEVRDKLRQKGIQGACIQKIVQRLKRMGLLNDREFAREFARSKVRRGFLGERAMRQELRKKGVAQNLLEKVITEVYAENDPVNLARALVNKRKGRYMDLEEKQYRKKMQDLLLRKGYDWEVIGEVLNDLE